MIGPWSVDDPIFWILCLIELCFCSVWVRAEGLSSRYHWILHWFQQLDCFSVRRNCLKSTANSQRLWCPGTLWLAAAVFLRKYPINGPWKQQKYDRSCFQNSKAWDEKKHCATESTRNDWRLKKRPRQTR